MKRIGLVTLYKDNFGSILQTYSTYQFLKMNGNSVILIKENEDRSGLQKLKNKCLVIYKCFKDHDYLIDKIKIKNAMRQEKNLLSPNTKKMMNQFVQSHFEIQEVNKRNLKKLNSEFDLFITGSDQVWNGYNEFFYLKFADKGKRIALAPSFGTEKIRKYDEKNVKIALLEFDRLSVREEMGVKIIKKLTGKEATRLSDPTILLSRNEWLKFANGGIKKSNYILIHFLNKPCELAISLINKYLKEYNCNVFCICNRYEEYKKLIKYEFIDITPYDYVSMINNADMVFTDSFHSTLFSLNMETQFLTFDRQHFHGNSQRDRIISLLERVEMKYRFVTTDIDIDSIVIKKWNSDEIFYNDRKNIKNYIKDRIG